MNYNLGPHIFFQGMVIKCKDHCIACTYMPISGHLHVAMPNICLFRISEYLTLHFNPGYGPKDFYTGNQFNEVTICIVCTGIYCDIKP